MRQMKAMDERAIGDAMWRTPYPHHKLKAKLRLIKKER